MLRLAIHLFIGLSVAAALSGCPEDDTTGTTDGSISADANVDAPDGGTGDGTDAQPEIHVDAAQCTTAQDCTDIVGQCSTGTGRWM
jgi:hypothetical protein